MEVKNHINNTLAKAKRWPLNRGIKYSSLLTNKSGLWKEVGLYKVVVGYDVLDKSFQQFNWEILERIAVIQTRKEYIYQKLLCF